jgi:3-oxoacyl-[acyl-carrier protein] reductase
MNHINQHFNSLVTGGVQGIGRAVVDLLVRRKDKVFVFDCIDPSDVRIEELKNRGVEYLKIDVSSVKDIIDGFKLIQQKISPSGNFKLHLLVNNAGITRDGLAVRMKEKDWDAVLNVNLKGSFFCSQQALKIMMRQPLLPNRQARGYIVNISSIVGKTGNPGQVNYASSKGGLIALTKTLAQEYASKQILVNAIAPGFIETSMTKHLPESTKALAISHIALKRFGSTYDVANLVIFYSSGQADYITGQVVDVTGGMP